MYLSLDHYMQATSQWSFKIQLKTKQSTSSSFSFMPFAMVTASEDFASVWPNINANLDFLNFCPP